MYIMMQEPQASNLMPYYDRKSHQPLGLLLPCHVYYGYPTWLAGGQMCSTCNTTPNGSVSGLVQISRHYPDRITASEPSTACKRILYR